MAKLILRQAAILLGLAFLPAIASALLRPPQPAAWENPPRFGDEISVQEAERLGPQALWLDARPDAQFEAAHVPGAIQLNEDRWNELLPVALKEWSPARTTVVYCSSQSCGASREVAERLRKEAGLKQVFVLDGGWESWQAAHK